MIRLLPLVLLLAACSPTGHSACDGQVRQRAVIEANGWTLDCTPPAEWEPHLGWADSNRKTVWVWADRILAGHNSGRAELGWVLWHEAGHTYGMDEWQANLYADAMEGKR